jgi:hypothetical protein
LEVGREVRRQSMEVRSMQLGKPNATASRSPLLTNKARNARPLHYNTLSLLFQVLLCDY